MPLPEVWIVDDDQLQRELLKDALSDVPCRFKELADGEELIAALGVGTPAVLLLDLVMPGRSGLDLLRAIKAKGVKARIVVVSGLDSEPLVQQAITDGAHGFLSKPFHPLDVVSVVRSALESWGAAP
jgi:two-component system chemotaxis response regulator CheY